MIERGSRGSGMEVPGGNRLRHFKTTFPRIVTQRDKNHENARKIARCRPPILSGETNGPSHACDWSDSLTRLGVADRPRRAMVDVSSPPCFLADRRSTTDGRHIPGGAPGGPRD